MSRPRSLIFWLLLAATIAIDAAAFSRGQFTYGEFPRADIYHEVICDALLASQVAVICIWAVLGSSKVLWVPALTAVLVASVAGAVCEESSETFISRWHLYVCLYGLEAALLMTALWLLRGSRYWRQTTEARKWRFSLAQLLLVMTAAAVLTTTMRTGPFADESKWANIGFALCVVVMSLVSVIVWSLPWHWLLRLAATLATAIVVGLACCAISQFGAPAFPVFEAQFVIQAILLSAWLGWGPILMRTNVAPPGGTPNSVQLSP